MSMDDSANGKRSACPICGSDDTRIFLELTGMPAQDGVVHATRQAALDAPAGDIKLAICRQCHYIDKPHILREVQPKRVLLSNPTHEREIRAQVEEMGGVVMALLAIGPIILATFGPPFIVGQPALVILVFGYLVQASTGPTSAYLAVSGNQDFIMVINASAAISNILLNIVMIPMAGVIDAAIAPVLSILLFQIWSYVLVRRRLRINPVFFANTQVKD